MKRDVNGLTPKAMEKLMQHDWPGNVRELENTLEYAVTMTQRDVVTDDLVLQTKVSTGAVATTGETIQAQLLPTNGSFKTLKEARSEFEELIWFACCIRARQSDPRRGDRRKISRRLL